MKKICVIATVILLFLSSFGLSVAVGSESKPQSPGNYSIVSVCPDDITHVDVGGTFSISVVGLDVENLYGFYIKFMWDPAIIECVSRNVMAPVESYEQGILHSPVLLLKDEVDPTSGTYEVACTSLSPADPFDGNGVFFVMTFKVLSLPNEKPFELVEAHLSDDKGQPIANSKNQAPDLVTDNEVTEFAPAPENNPHYDSRNRRAQRWLEWWITQMRRRFGLG
jgi:hypothetical protein